MSIGMEQRQQSYWWQGALMTFKASRSETAGALGMVEARFPGSFGPPLHVHHREDEAFYVLEGEILFVRGDEEVLARPGDLVFCPRELAHAFKTSPDGARALILFTPGGFEQMFVDGGAPADGAEPPAEADYDVAELAAQQERFGFEVVGTPLD